VRQDLYSISGTPIRRAGNAYRFTRETRISYISRIAELKHCFSPIYTHEIERPQQHSKDRTCLSVFFHKWYYTTVPETPMHLRAWRPPHPGRAPLTLARPRPRSAARALSIHPCNASMDCLSSTEATTGHSWFWLGYPHNPVALLTRRRSSLVDRSRAARTEDLALSSLARGRTSSPRPGRKPCHLCARNHRSAAPLGVCHRSSRPVASPPADERDAHETKKNQKDQELRTISSRPGRFTARGSPARSSQL
jgi:hypothetical protein